MAPERSRRAILCIARNVFPWLFVCLLPPEVVTQCSAQIAVVIDQLMPVTRGVDGNAGPHPFLTPGLLAVFLLQEFTGKGRLGSHIYAFTRFIILKVWCRM